MTETSPLRDSALLAASHHCFLLAIGISWKVQKQLLRGSDRGACALRHKTIPKVHFISTIINFESHPNEKNASPTTLTAGDLEQPT